ncbi:hypothetical protein Tco_0981726, partial [Tanacetum coccineum]
RGDGAWWCRYDDDYDDGGFGGGDGYDDDDGTMMMMMVVAVARGASGVVDRVDPVTGIIFGVGRKSPTEKFSGGGGGRRRWWPDIVRERENEGDVNNSIVATMQVNVQFLQQLQQEWSRFVTIMKQQHKLDEVSYHKLFDILKQYQKEVNELRAERMAKNANPLALVATAQTLQDTYYQTSKPHKSYAPTPDLMQLQDTKAKR